MKIAKKAQFSIEYILVTAFAMLILLASISVIYSQYAQSRASVGETQIDKIAREIATTSGEVYYMGKPAKATLELYFPDNIDDICIGGVTIKDPSDIKCSNKEIVFYTKKGGEMVYSVQNYVTMDKSKKIKLNEGIHRIILKADDSLKICYNDGVSVNVVVCSQPSCDPNTETLYPCNINACTGIPPTICAGFPGSCDVACGPPESGVLISQK